MQRTKVTSILTLLFLLSLLACPLMVIPQLKDSGHDCSGKQDGEKDQKMHFCCDQQAIATKGVSWKSMDSVIMPQPLPVVDCISVSLHANGTSLLILSQTDDLLAKLSILRI